MLMQIILRLPVTLIAMAAAEIAGLGESWLWAGGLSLLVGRQVPFLLERTRSTCAKYG